MVYKSIIIIGKYEKRKVHVLAKKNPIKGNAIASTIKIFLIITNFFKVLNLIDKQIADFLKLDLKNYLLV